VWSGACFLRSAVAEPVGYWAGEEVEAWARDYVIEVVVYVECVDCMAGWRVRFAHVAVRCGAACGLARWEVGARATCFSPEGGSWLDRQFELIYEGPGCELHDVRQMCTFNRSGDQQ